jgi:integrase
MPHNTPGFARCRTRRRRTSRTPLPLAFAGRAPVKLHDLRHYYASGLIAAGCDVVTVQRALGHASATVTLNTYAHLRPTAEARTRAAAASMLAETLSTADSVRNAVTCQDSAVHTLKRNSTTSPSRIT